MTIVATTHGFDADQVSRSWTTLLRDSNAYFALFGFRDRINEDKRYQHQELGSRRAVEKPQQHRPLGISTPIGLSSRKKFIAALASIGPTVPLGIYRTFVISETHPRTHPAAFPASNPHLDAPGYQRLAWLADVKKWASSHCCI